MMLDRSERSDLCEDHASAAIQTDGFHMFRLMVVGFRNAIKEQMKSVIPGRNFFGKDCGLASRPLQMSDNWV